MNRLQYLLLKVVEESGEIADEVLTSGLSAQVHSEINDLEAVLRLIEKEFYTKPIFSGRLMAQDASKTTLIVQTQDWSNELLKACLALSKIASKCMQFGLLETQAERTERNIDRMGDAVLHLFNMISVLNQFYSFNYQVDEERVAQKILKIKKYHEYSISLGLVSNEPVPQDQYPEFKVFVDEYNYFGHYDAFVKKNDSGSENANVIGLPMKNI